jgi:NifU-like protein involved in Fe-S cluster formation
LRRHSTERPIAPGPMVIAPDGLSVRFDIELDSASCLTGVQFRCTTCATMLALCEHLAEMVAGLPASEALQITPQHLLELHNEIPEERRDRAALAVAGLRLAVISRTPSHL